VTAGYVVQGTSCMEAARFPRLPSCRVLQRIAVRLGRRDLLWYTWYTVEGQPQTPTDTGAIGSRAVSDGARCLDPCCFPLLGWRTIFRDILTDEPAVLVRRGTFPLIERCEMYQKPVDRRAGGPHPKPADRRAENCVTTTNRSNKII
jgi:hypothetical protein